MKNPHLTKAIAFCISFILVHSNSQAQTYNLVVAKDGTGNYTTVQAAIDAAPTGQATPYTIFIKNGKYKEKITVPSNKPFLQLIGESVANVILIYDDYSGKPMPGGGTYGTSNSASVTINAADFSAFNITFENTTGDAPQAVAVNVNADRAAFKNCRFLGGQDTLLTNVSGNRQYFRNCYIDGVVDFIFGGAQAVFDSCVVYPKTRKDGLSGSYITAANTAPGQSYGYVFRNCVIPMNRGVTTYVLGRPWQNSCPTPTSYPRVVFLNTAMSAVVKPEGWSTWDACTNTSQVQYAEYKSRYFNGTLLSVSQRVAWSSQLGDADAANYTLANIFSGWDPCAVYNGFCASSTPWIAVSNFQGTKGATTATFTWNGSWGIDQVLYELYRGTTQYGAYAKISEVISPNDTTFNFSLPDANPPSGSIYYYYVKASKAGYNTHITDTVQVSSAPTISTSGTLAAFYQSVGTPSPTQSYTVSGTDLQGNVTITPPLNFEISNNGGTNWYTNSTPLTLTQSGGALPNTTITLRLNAGSAATYSGDIGHQSINASTVNLAVSGTTSNPPAINSTLLQQWPFTLNSNDSAAVRSAFVTASTPSFNNLYSSNGTQVPAAPAYSTVRGQAFGASSNGDGSWGTATGGPGGNLNRIYYEQFTVTASGSALRVDSIILSSAFYNTSSNTKLAIVYSKTGFTTNDSADITGGVDQTGNSVTGSFSTPLLLANQTGGPTNTYRLALNGATGVTITNGQTLTVRLYFSCGSTSMGRYAMLKDVNVKGEALSAMPLSLLTFTGSYAGESTKLVWKTANEQDVQEYVIERSVDDIQFIKLGAVNARNTILNDYSFTDLFPYAGANYYRLKMVGRDGTFHYSRYILINTITKPGLQVYPNPAKDIVTAVHEKAGKGAAMELIGLDGKKLVRVQVEEGAVQTRIDLSPVPGGSYLIVYSDGGKRTTFKFIKQ